MIQENSSKARTRFYGFNLSHEGALKRIQRKSELARANGHTLSMSTFGRNGRYVVIGISEKDSENETPRLLN